MSLLHLKPSLSLETAVGAARALFGVDGVAVPLPGERDQNFRIDAYGGGRYVLKIANASESPAMLEAEHLAMIAAGALSPRPVPSRAGRAVETLELGGRPHLVRLLTWIDGVPLATAGRRSPALLRSVGRVVADVDRGLAAIDHPAVHREFAWDLAHAPAVLARETSAADEAGRSFVAHALALQASHVAPVADRLPRQAIHNDANDYNVLVEDADDAVGLRSQEVVGLVDFGDMVWSARVHDVAVAAAYALLGEDEPLRAIVHLVQGYHETLPLEEVEIAALFPLVLLRLALSVHHAWAQAAERPDDPYLVISQAPIRAAMPALVAIHPRLAHYTLRHACDLPPVPHGPAVVSWLQAHAASFAPVLEGDPGAHAVPVDLSVESPLVSSNPDANGPDALGERIAREIARASGGSALAVGAGGYGEPRVLYTAPAFQGSGPLGEPRTVHLGLDLTAPPGTEVRAPLDGVVHGVEDAAARLDYGPVVVLRHDQAGAPFFTLYGHLSASSLEGMRAGRRVAAGERIGWIGAPPGNGDWWPHLHFQVITDLLDVACNVNGSARPSECDVWLSLCPDPNLLVGIPRERLPRRRSTASLRESRAAHVGRNVRLSYREPLRAARGWMQYLFDADGRRYLDAYNNVPHVGHAHPSVTEAVASQLARLNTNTRYLQTVHAEFVEALLATFPAPLSVCYLTASGSEATELALRLARARTRQRDVLVLDAAYHGHTTTAIEISPYKHEGPGGEGAPPWVHKAPLPDVYRGAYRASDPEAGHKYAAAVGACLERIRAAGRGVCAYIAETCPSVGGQLMLPAGYLPEVYRLVRAAGGVVVADEVQTGLGRIGTHFWAFLAHDVVPDIVVMGKPLGNGYPLGAVVTTAEVAAAFDNGMEFFSTFGGSSAACAAGLATLRVTQGEGLMDHAREVGDRLLSSLRAMQDRHALVGDVRGSGLFVGVELVRDRDTLEPAAVEAAFVVDRLRELGVLTGTDGPHHNVIKIRGPMPMSHADAGLLMAALDRALVELV